MRRFWCLLWCWLSVACVGTETGNPSFDGSLGYDAYSSAESVSLAASSLAGAVQADVESTWLVLGKVSFVPKTGASCAVSSSADSGPSAPGLGAGDHVKTQAPPTQLALVSGLYCGVKLALDRSPANTKDIPADLIEHSLLVQGRLDDGRSFELLSALEAELPLRSDTSDGFELDADRAGVLIGFDLASWLEGLPWRNATDTDGKIVADAAHNPALLAEFEKRLPTGISLFRDADGDGKLDADRVRLAHSE